MMRTLCMLLCLAAAPLGGCAGALRPFVDPVVSSDKLDEANEMSKLKSYSGDRRLVRVQASALSPLRRGYYTYTVCAETQADAIAARGYSGSATWATGRSIQDQATEELLLTYGRTELSDLVRQLSWQLCNARLNDDITKDQYQKGLELLIKDSLAAAKARAGPTPPNPPIPGTRTQSQQGAGSGAASGSSGGAQGSGSAAGSNAAAASSAAARPAS